MKKAINKCPICGGEIGIYANVRVCVAIGEDGSSELVTEAREILDDVLGQVGKKTADSDKFEATRRADGVTDISFGQDVVDDVMRPYKAICDDCECDELIVRRLPNGDFEVSVDEQMKG